MLDIGKFVRDEHLSVADMDGNMYGLDSWSPHKALACAGKEGIVLTDEHWAVIYAVREIHRRCGDELNAREIGRLLEQEFGDDDGGRRRLYELFPGGPVSQASRIAGVPVPAHSADLSFGSVL